MNAQMATAERLIVALDFDRGDDALGLVETLGDSVSFYKVGWQLFIREGMTFVHQLKHEKGKKVFLDVKFDEIPRTVRETVANIAVEGVDFFTIHGNGATAEAALQGRGERPSPKFLFLTLLSSLDQQDLHDLFVSDEVRLDSYVLFKAQKAVDCGIDGVIASGESVHRIRSNPEFDGLTIVTPGIRPEGASIDDHKRTLTPYRAIVYGSNYLVVGRPIIKSNDPRRAAESIIEEMERGDQERKRLEGSHDEHRSKFSGLLAKAAGDH